MLGERGGGERERERERKRESELERIDERELQGMGCVKFSSMSV